MKPIVESHAMAAHLPSQLSDSDARESVEHCKQMVDLIGRQMADLDRLHSQLRVRYDYWERQLTALTVEGGSPTAKPRAPRGQLRATIQEALRENATGLTLEEIDRALRSRLSNYNNRHSISDTLGRLRRAGVLCYRDGKWQLNVRGDNIP